MPEQIQAYKDRWQKKVEREDRQAGLIAWLYAEAHRNPTVHPAPFTLEQFMPHTPSDASKAADRQAENQRTLAEVFKRMAANGLGQYSDAS